MERSESIAGTYEYMAPEMIKRDGTNMAVDWWALGIILYEMLFGQSPFDDDSQVENLLKIIDNEVEFPERGVKGVTYSDDLKDLIFRLLIKDKDERLGSNGDFKEIMKHPFFADINVDELLKKEIIAEHLPMDLDFENSMQLELKMCQTAIGEDE